ncbi:MAG: hypothetical protein QW327_05960 [Candidatus Odinarchaeota archaeon]
MGVSLSRVNEKERKFFLTFLFAYILWMLIYARFESSVKWAYGAEYWAILVFSHFTAISIIVFTAAKHFDRDVGVIKERFIRLSLILGGIVTAGFMLEDFLAVAFAGLFNTATGVCGSVAGIPYLDPHYGYYVEPALPTGYFQINSFKIPWAYLYLSLIGFIMICIGSRINVDERVRYWRRILISGFDLENHHLSRKLKYEKFSSNQEIYLSERQLE